MDEELTLEDIEEMLGSLCADILPDVDVDALDKSDG